MSRLRLLGCAVVVGFLSASCSRSNDATPSKESAPGESASAIRDTAYEDAQRANAFIEAAGRGDLQKVRGALASGISVDSRFRSFEFLGS
jgi:hypothetical protein